MKFPSHLYRRNGTFYFRWALTPPCRARLAPCPADVRLSIDAQLPCSTQLPCGCTHWHWRAASLRVIPPQVSSSQKWNFLVTYSEESP